MAPKRILLCALLVVTFSCQRSAVPVGDTSRNALDWTGNYHGVLPCADCRGILTGLQLREDNTFSMSLSYLGRGDTKQSKVGSFTWNRAENEITLKGLSDSTPPVYKVAENRLIPIHPSTTNASAGRYVLTKDGYDITNRYWRLVSVNDREVTQVSPRKEAHLILLSTDSTVTGNGSCNNFRGSFEMTSDNEISFSSMATTKMACMENMEVEHQLLKNLIEVRSYQVAGDSLLLFDEREMKTIAFVMGD